MICTRFRITHFRRLLRAAPFALITGCISGTTGVTTAIRPVDQISLQNPLPTPSATATPSPTISPTTSPTPSPTVSVTPSPTPVALPTAPSATVTYGSNIVISTGGTYSGNWQSPDTATPAVSIVTSDPVIIENCSVKGPGDLIRAWNNTDVTVRNCNGYGIAPTDPSAEQGTFVNASQTTRLWVFNNYFEHVKKGVMIDHFNGSGSGIHTIRIIGNVGRNAHGGVNRFASFVQFNGVVAIPNVEVGWNQFINVPGQNYSEDDINFYNSSGTAASRFNVHDNFIQGAYPSPATASSYTGSGMTSDGDGTPSLVPAYIEASFNVVLATGNAAMNLAGGHHIRYHDNRMVTSGVLMNGAGTLDSAWAATNAWNYFNQDSTLYGHNEIDHNVIGFFSNKGCLGQSPLANRCDVLPDCDAGTCHDNTRLPAGLTLQSEVDEWTRWNAGLVASGQYIGSSAHANNGRDRRGSGAHPFF